MGRIAAHFLLKTAEPMSKLRGKTYNFENINISIVVTYHPAYLLRSPREKRKAYDDLLILKKILST